jgi:UDP-glucose 4-epimerase
MIARLNRKEKQFMNIIVTGGLGFIGSHIVDRLVQEGFHAYIIDNLSTGNMNNLHPKAKFYQIDILDLENLKSIFAEVKPVAVFHLAAQIDVQKSIQLPNFDAQNNIIGTLNILECCKIYQSRLIYSSSAAVYGTPHYLPVDEKHPIQPLSNYGISKFTPELYIKSYAKLYNLKYVILRYANAYGPRQMAYGEGGVISIFIDKMIHDESPTIFGMGAQTRDFIFVKDVVSANLAALNSGENCTCNISTNQRISVLDLFKSINQILNKKLVPIFKAERLGDIDHSCLDNSLSKVILNWQPKFTITEGLKETCHYVA